MNIKNVGEYISESMDKMERGVFNHCKDGKCSECGECCSALLPVSVKEVKAIRSYVRARGIKLHDHTKGSPVMKPTIDMVCPFLDTTKKNHKCDIYPVRPEICKVFRCDQPPSTVKRNRDKFWETHEPVYMHDIMEDKHGK